MTTISTFYQPSATLHYDTILWDISGFTFPNGLPEEMNPPSNQDLNTKEFWTPLGRRVA